MYLSSFTFSFVEKKTAVEAEETEEQVR